MARFPSEGGIVRRITGAKGDRTGLGRERRWPIKPSPPTPSSSWLPLSYLRAAKFRPSARWPVVFVYVFVVRPSVTKLDANVSAKGKPSVNGRKKRGAWLSSCFGPILPGGPKATTKVGGREWQVRRKNLSETIPSC